MFRLSGYRAASVIIALTDGELRENQFDMAQREVTKAAAADFSVPPHLDLPKLLLPGWPSTPVGCHRLLRGPEGLQRNTGDPAGGFITHLEVQNHGINRHFVAFRCSSRP